MPVPETFLLYGDATLVVPSSPHPVAHITNTTNRSVTRTVTLHFTHGWRYNSSAGVHFWIDLDGTLYQNNEADRRWRHVSGAPYFNTHNLVRNTSVAVEVCRFGKIRARAGGGWEIPYPSTANPNYTINFSDDPNDPEECDYSFMGAEPGPQKFNLWKIQGGDTHQSVIRPRYKIKSAEFDDDRNPESTSGFVRDILFTEEQLATLVLWLKSILEHYRIPKLFLHDPVSGKENPWIDTDVLARRNQPRAIRDEAIERASSHQGVWGHMNLQRSRVDPGASMDYYRLKRGISDQWWYPVNLNETTRVLNYLDVVHNADYLALKNYGSLSELEDYYRLNETGNVGFYPVGANRVWHGGIHLNSEDSEKEVYAMANGWIVAARVTNGLVNGQNLSYSRCFVLVKHLVHTQDSGNEIDYGANSTHILYSLYMHLEPAELTQQPDGADGHRWNFDYATMPPWLCHFLIDNPTPTEVNTGGIIYPNHKVDLSDCLGTTGLYITEVPPVNPVHLGRTVHVEVFTTEDPNTFADNPWAATDKRIIDPTPNNLIADRGMLDRQIHDTAGDGIDIVDIKNAAPSMRSHAIKSRSEWSLTDKNQLAHHQNSVTDEEWNMFIRPLCFHTDIAADAAAPSGDIGPFHGNTTVWHFHPFTFLKWMNERVDRHERILAEQDKPRPTFTSNIQVTGGYVTGFQNLGGRNPKAVPQQTGGVVYPEAEYNENSYEVTVDKLTDQEVLATGDQNITRFNLHLLEAVDICNDRLHGLQILEGFVSAGVVRCSDSGRHSAHRVGDAVDLRPANTTVADWYNLYDSARQAVTYLQERHDLDLELKITTDPSPGVPSQIELNEQAEELERRIKTALDVGDAVLTNAPTLQHVDQMRLHIGIEPSAAVPPVELNNLQWLDAASYQSTNGPALAGKRLSISVQTVGLSEGVMVEVFIMSELLGKTIPPDITDILTLKKHYHSGDFDLSQIEQHEMRATTIDRYVQRARKQITGIDDTGRATIVFDWQVPQRLPTATGSLYAVCIVAKGAAMSAGGTTIEHTVGSVLGDVRILTPQIRQTNWTLTAGGRPVSTINRINHSRGLVDVETDALPGGCQISISVRDTEDNRVVLETSRAVAAGRARSTFECNAPSQDIQYHATVRVTKSAPQRIDLTSGAGIVWTH